MDAVIRVDRPLEQPHQPRHGIARPRHEDEAIEPVFRNLRTLEDDRGTGGAVAKQPEHRSVHREGKIAGRSEEHTSELQSLMRISYAVFCLKKKKKQQPEDCIRSMK